MYIHMILYRISPSEGLSVYYDWESMWCIFAWWEQEGHYQIIPRSPNICSNSIKLCKINGKGSSNRFAKFQVEIVVTGRLSLNATLSGKMVDLEIMHLFEFLTNVWTIFPELCTDLGGIEHKLWLLAPSDHVACFLLLSVCSGTFLLSTQKFQYCIKLLNLRSVQID